MIYFYDCDIKYPPTDADLLLDVRIWEYWTITPGEDIQLYVTEHKLKDWRLITNRPERYTTLVSITKMITNYKGA